MTKALAVFVICMLATQSFATNLRNTRHLQPA